MAISWLMPVVFGGAALCVAIAVLSLLITGWRQAGDWRNVCASCPHSRVAHFARVGCVWCTCSVFVAPEPPRIGRITCTFCSSPIPGEPIQRVTWSSGYEEWQWLCTSCYTPAMRRYDWDTAAAAIMVVILVLTAFASQCFASR